MVLSLEFKRAIAAAAVTRLSAGRRNLTASAEWVAESIGDALYPSQKGETKIQMILDYRKKILGVSNRKEVETRLTVARYHYDQCLDWISKNKLKPEESARLLIKTMIQKR